MSHSKFVNVRSSDRDTGGSSVTFGYTLSHPITKPTRISLLSAEIPVMALNIRSNRNTFQWIESSTARTATVTSGSYTTSTLLTALASAMNGVTGNTYTFTSSTTTYKVSVSTTNSISITATNLSTALGFSSGQSGTSITATNAPCLSAWDLYWAIQLTNVPSNYGNKSVMKTFKIPIMVDTSYVNYFSANSSFEQYTNVSGMNSLGSLQVNLVDAFGNTVDLQGVEWSFLVRVDYLE